MARNPSTRRSPAHSSNGRGHRTTLASALGMLGGAGLGAAIMYLFDPEQGQRRRHQLVELAEHTVDSTADALSGAVHHAREHAGEFAAAIPAAMPAMPDTAALRDRATQWWDSARSHLPYGQPARRSHHVSAACAAMGVATALVLGIGAMWVFDPARGRGRRAWLVQKGTRAVHETGQFMSATGRHLRNKAKGYVHSVMPA